MAFRLPHPLVLLLGAVGVAAALTWILPAGEFDRRDDTATGRTVVVAGTYHAVEPAPVGPFAAVVAVPRGFVEAAEVIAVILFVGGAWVVVDKLGALARLVSWLVGAFRGRGLLAIPVVAFFFAAMGALENMQEEIIPLVPVLLLLGRGLGIDAVAVVAMSAGAAMVGSAFGPTNPFQAGIAMKLAELPVSSAFWLRLAMFGAAFLLWVTWTMRHARRERSTSDGVPPGPSSATATTTDVAMVVILLVPMFAYVWGAYAWDWGFHELSAGFLLAGLVVGLIGGLGLGGTTSAYLEGMQALLPSAVLVGVARTISLVLADGRVIDSVLHSLATMLASAPPAVSAVLMIPAHALIHVAVPSVSGQAVLTMPVFVPLGDLLTITRDAVVIAYQTGAGLTEIITPTNGALMATLLAAGVSYQQWIRFAAAGVLLLVLVGVAGIFAAS